MLELKQHEKGKTTDLIRNFIEKKAFIVKTVVFQFPVSIVVVTVAHR